MKNVKSFPKVSIVVPCYNVEKYVSRALDSLINQTLKDIEIICVDDKSTDGTLHILKSYAKKDKRIKVIKHINNFGAAVARNNGLKITQGEYIGFVDADDYVDLNFFKEMYLCAKKNKADIVKSNVNICENNKENIVSEEKHIKKITNLGKWYFLYQWWSGIYSRRLLSSNHIKFPDDVISGQDVVFLTYCVKCANKVVCCPNVFYHYIKRNFSLDSKYLSPKKTESKLKAVDLITDVYNTSDMSKEDYVWCYHDRWNKIVKNLFVRNTDVQIKQLVAYNFIALYEKCRFKPDLLQLHIQYDSHNEKYIKYIQSHDVDGLVKFMNMPKQNCYNSTFLLFGCIPIVSFKRNFGVTKLKLFGINIIQLKKAHSYIKIIFFYVPIFKIKVI